jgi:hypothetical protein
VGSKREERRFAGFSFCSLAVFGEHFLRNRASHEGELCRRRRLLGNVVTLGLEAVLVGDVVQRDHLTVRCCPGDRSLDGEFFVLRAQVVHNSGFLA